jgi:hypothetical protein
LYNNGNIEWIEPIPIDITNAELLISVIPLSNSQDRTKIDPCVGETLSLYEHDLLQTASHRHQPISISCTEQHTGSTGTQVDSDDELHVDAAFFLAALEDDESEDAVWEKYLT